MAEFIPFPGSENPNWAMDVCDKAAIIADPQTQEALLFVGVSLLYNKSFGANADKLQQIIVDAINEAIMSAVVPAPPVLSGPSAAH